MKGTEKTDSTWGKFRAENKGKRGYYDARPFEVQFVIINVLN